MKKQVVLIMVMGVLSLLGTATSQAAVWVGPNLVTNGDFSVFNGVGWSFNSVKWLFFDGYTACNWGKDQTMFQQIYTQPGKRYRVSGQSYAYHSGVGPVEQRTKIGFGGLETDWWNPGFSKVLTTKTTEGIYEYEVGSFVLTHDVINDFLLGSMLSAFDNLGLYQVVYSPTVSISQKQNGVRINSNTPGGSSANISLTLNNATGFADALTSWSMNWGDGAIEPSPTFNSHSHTYSIASGNSQTWTSTFSGTNQAATVFDTDTVTILRQPDIALLVNDMFVIDGQTVAIDIFDNPTLDLSLLYSKGYLEGASFQIDGKLNQTGSDLASFLYLGNLFDESDVGLTYSLTAGVYNTGLGVNSDWLSVNLSVVPEPATLFLLGLGGMFLRTKRKA